MSTFTITIDMDGAAFEDNPTELGDILRAVADRMDATYTDVADTTPVLDSNGNTVGSWSIA